MPSLRDIRRRIRSVRNTAKITRAMQMVAASRMRRAQQRVIAARPYAEAMRSLIGQLSGVNLAADELHPLLAQRPIDTVGVVLLTSDRGLCGALNTNIIRRASQVILEAGELTKPNSAERRDIELITVGRKGQDFMARRGHALLGTFTQLGDQPSYMDVVGVARVVMDSYLKGVMDECWIVYPEFVNTLVQRPAVVKLLPIAPTEELRGPQLEYIFEPSPAEILNELLPRYVEVTIYQAVLESIASEQSARMVAMRNATDNANELVQGLTLTYNKARQAAITREVTEIASAAEAMAAS
jgi:F-type H+-transporting ATPase subunit gamma